MAFEGLSDKLSGVFKKLRGRGRLTEGDIKEAMREVRLALLEADVNYKVVKDFVAKVSERAIGENVMDSLTPAQQVVKIVNDELTSLMGVTNAKLNISSEPPTVVMLVGLQGAGKTTNGAKLAGYYKKQGKRPLLAACDIYRPAAIKQLQVVGEQMGVPVFEMGQISPVEITRAALEHADRHGNDMVFIDTAGRLHIDDDMMAELVGIKELAKPSEVILFIDAMTGQDAVNAASTFDEKLGIDSVFLTKLDGDTRGGVALSVRAVTGKPIKFAGIGEKLTVDAIEPFYPDRMASRILGMGDMLSLIEKAQQNLDDKKAAELEARLRQNQFTLDDFLTQMGEMKKMGSMQDILGMLPGVNKAQLQNAQIDERALAKTEAIILSMTKRERNNPDILNFSRKKRIAAGSGSSLEEINRLLKQFNMTKQMMKQFTGGGSKKMRRKLGAMGLPGKNQSRFPFA